MKITTMSGLELSYKSWRHYTRPLKAYNRKELVTYIFKILANKELKAEVLGSILTITRYKNKKSFLKIVDTYTFRSGNTLIYAREAANLEVCEYVANSI